LWIALSYTVQMKLALVQIKFSLIRNREALLQQKKRVEIVKVGYIILLAIDHSLLLTILIMRLKLSNIPNP
jgi:hypothetical protein